MTSDLTFWLDAHVPPELAPWLGATFKIIVKTLDEIDLREAKDPLLFDAARRFGNIVIVTKDEDFADIVGRLGIPPQILWLTVGNVTPVALQLILSRTFAAALGRLNAGEPLVEISR